MVETLVTYKATQDERIDQLSFKFFGVETYTQDIYEANPELLEIPSLLLAAGTIILIPKVDLSKVSTQIKVLWGN